MKIKSKVRGGTATTKQPGLPGGGRSCG